MPKALEPNELEATLATYDRRTLIDSRDYAVLVLLGRLGLRAFEIAALQLDDLDWNTGEMVVRGLVQVDRPVKGSTVLVMGLMGLAAQRSEST